MLAICTSSLQPPVCATECKYLSGPRQLPCRLHPAYTFTYRLSSTFTASKPFSGLRLRRGEGSLLEIGVVHLGFACLCFPVSQTQICIIIVISFYGKKVKDKPPRGMCYACGLVSGCSLPRLIAVQHPPPTRRLLLHCPTLLCGLRRPRARGYISQIHKYTRSRVSAKCRLLRRSVASVGDKRAARVPPSVCREAEISAICAQ